VDHIVGGGFAYRRMQLLFGGRSSGKNALLYQTIAYNQRLCKNCGGVLPEFGEMEVKDRWTDVLMNICAIPLCNCGNSEGRIACFFDYERSLSTEAQTTRNIHTYIDKATGEKIDELDYNDKCVEYETLTSSNDYEISGDTDLIDAKAKKARIKELEKYFEGIEVSSVVVPSLPTKDYVKECGVLIDRLLVADPEFTEEGIDMVIPIIKSRGADIIVWDSLQAAIPLRVYEKDADQATMGIEARQNGLLMRKVCSAFAAGNLEDPKEAFKPAFFIISQVRANLGMFVSGPDTFSGGKAVEHHIALALELKREHFLKASGERAEFKDTAFGQKVRLRAEKNKLNNPSSMYEFDYYFCPNEFRPIGIDHRSELVYLAIRENIIERVGSYYIYNDMKFHGMNKVLEYMNENYPKSYADVYKKLFHR